MQLFTRVSPNPDSLSFSLSFFFFQPPCRALYCTTMPSRQIIRRRKTRSRIGSNRTRSSAPRHSLSKPWLIISYAAWLPRREPRWQRSSRDFPSTRTRTCQLSDALRPQTAPRFTLDADYPCQIRNEQRRGGTPWSNATSSPASALHVNEEDWEADPVLVMRSREAMRGRPPTAASTETTGSIATAFAHTPVGMGVPDHRFS